MELHFKSLIQLLDFFKDEKTCYDFLQARIWPDTKPTCPHCGSMKVWTTKTRSKLPEKQGINEYRCAEKLCGMKFSVTTGTIFESSKVSLRTWFAAIYLITSAKKGVSSLQIGRQLNITQKTGWFLLQRIREMLKETTAAMLTGIVEVDETYVGGKKGNKHNKIRKAMEQGTGYIHKTPVVAMLQRDGKILITALPNRTNVDGSVLRPLINQSVNKDATIITDGFAGYVGLAKEYAAHEVVNHTQHEYVRGLHHTNTVEGFFSILKRGIYGIYHQVSPKHLHRYCDEFGYRYNSRLIKDNQRFGEAVEKVTSARITYRTLIGK